MEMKKCTALWGATIGDIVGSPYEFNNLKSKDFPLFSVIGFFTDDTAMTVAVADALMNVSPDASDEVIAGRIARRLLDYGRHYPHIGYGHLFREWLKTENPAPYNSWGNGAPMRCSAAGWMADSMESAARLARLSALPTHNHPEGIKAAVVTAQLIYLARTGESMDAMRSFAEKHYAVPVIDEIRESYHFTESSMETMPVVLAAFFESVSFEDTIRNAVSVGGDSDTIAAIAGSIAEAYYGVPEEIIASAENYLDRHLLTKITTFSRY